MAGGASSAPFGVYEPKMTGARSAAIAQLSCTRKTPLCFTYTSHVDGRLGGVYVRFARKIVE